MLSRIKNTLPPLFKCTPFNAFCCDLV